MDAEEQQAYAKWLIEWAAELHDNNNQSTQEGKS